MFISIDLQHEASTGDSYDGRRHSRASRFEEDTPVETALSFIREEEIVAEHEDWQVSDDAAVVYEEFWVPAMLGQWAPQVADAANIAPGDRVLDVACGTGVVTREAADRAGPTGRVTGLDINEGMLAVAKRVRPEIDWLRGDAAELPFEDESFDVVTCQFSLMYFPDRPAALKEMMRVLEPDGRLALAVWGPFERATAYVILTEITERRCGKAAADVLTAPFVLGEEDTLLELLHSAGIHGAVVDLRDGTVTFDSIEQLIEYEVKGTPLGELLDEEGYAGVLSEAVERLQPFIVDAEVRIPMDAHVISALKT